VVRHGILPRLERNLNPWVREVLAETAEIARAEEEYWTAKIAELMPKVLKPSDSTRIGGMLDGRILSAQPVAVQRRLVRAFAASLGFKLAFKHVEQVLRTLSDSKHNQSIILPEGWEAIRSAAGINFQRSCTLESSDYEYRLGIPGRIRVPEAGKFIEAVLVRPGVESAYNLDHAINPARLGKELQVRNWRAGDRFWPGHCKSPKKLKQLLQDRHMTGMERKRVPVVVSGNEIIWLAGFPVPAALRSPDPKQEAVIIQQTEI
jgi:tRNA(Ile)-lysidine synthase